MAEDPRRPIVAVMARLGRETQLHLDERYRHFRITDAVIIVITLLLVILAVFNVYYVRIVYTDLGGIVTNMDSMHRNLRRVDGDMSIIADRVTRFRTHVMHMEPIGASITGLAETVPVVRKDMDRITGDMRGIEQDMQLLGRAMHNIDRRMVVMNGGVHVIRENVRQFARPMGQMNPFMP